MKNLIIKSNDEIDDDLLNRILQFDRTLFPVNDDYSFPDDYLKRMYSKFRYGVFVLLDNEAGIGYANCIFLSDNAQEKYLKDRDYLALENIRFNKGSNNMYFYTIALQQEYRGSNIVKVIMHYFANWLDAQKNKGKRIKSCISEAITNDGIRTLTIMGMVPLDIDDNGLGLYYSPDCLENYIEQMKKWEDNY